MVCNPALLSFPASGDKAVVVGAGRSGQAAARLLVSEGVTVRVLEQKSDSLDPIFVEWAADHGVDIVVGTHTADHFAHVNAIIPSPGAPISSILPLLPKAGRPEILAETELAWRLLEGEPVIAVTGTSGKTTTVSLVAAMLEAHGLNVFLGGNIGTPLSEYVLERREGGRPRADVLVLELSSFQLQTVSSFRPKVGILLNISANHLDYHKDMAEYIEAKMRLFGCQGQDDVAILGPGLAELPQRRTFRSRVISFDPYCNRFPRTALLGRHNQANAEAAWQACLLFGVTEEEAARAMEDFTPLPNRLERVGEVDGVLYVNDSKCTTVEAMRVALEAFDRPVHLLAGGKFKGGDLPSLCSLLTEKVRGVYLYGASREVFEEAWQGCVPLSWDETLRQAMTRAAQEAQAGDVVLLAPATSSYDQYRDYLERGEDFRSAVRTHLDTGSFGI